MNQTEEKIAHAHDNCDTSLILGDNQLTTLPSSISTLTNLQELHLWSSQLKTLPESISALTNLQWLNLWSNQLTTLPSSITALTSLQQLYFWSNQLTELPSSIPALTNLHILQLSSNHLTALPASISALTNLQQLYLSNNQLTALPASISALINLQLLDLSNNQLTTLSSSIFALTNLERLDLSSNQLATLPSSISALSPLRHLDCSKNQLTHLPLSILSLITLTTFTVDGNPLKYPPLTVVQKGIPAIREFFDKAMEEIEVPQKKIVIVGEGHVGKTSLVKRLKDVWLYPLQGSSRTEGVDIHTIELSKGTFVSVWDFAGQEHFLSSHKLYFTKNSVFVIVIQLIDRYEQISSQLRKWMFIVHQLCPDSKIVIVATKLDLLKQSEFEEKAIQIDYIIATLQNELQINLEIDYTNELSRPKFFAISNEKSTNISKITDVMQRFSKSEIISTLKGSGFLLKIVKESKGMCVNAKLLANQSHSPIKHCIEILQSLESLGMVVYLASSDQDEEATVILDGDLISKAFNHLKIKCKSTNNATSKTGWIAFSLARSVIDGRDKFKLLIEVLEKAQLIYVEKKGEVKDWKIFIPQIALDNNTPLLPKNDMFNFSFGRVYIFKYMLPIGFFEQLTIQMQFFAQIASCGIQISSHGIKLFGDSQAVYIRKIKLGDQFAVQLVSQSGKGPAMPLILQVIEAFEECLFSYFKEVQRVSKFVQRLAMCSCDSCQQRFRDDQLTIDHFLPLTSNDQLTERRLSPLLSLYIMNTQYAGCADSNASVAITDLLFELTSFTNLPLIDFKNIQVNKDAVKGSGGFGTVRTGLLPNGQQVAVKEINDIQTAFKEIRLLRMISHEHILKIIGYSRNKDSSTNTEHMYIITELLDKSLKQLIHDMASDLILLLNTALGIAQGIAYLHSHEPPIIHRDIKPDNIMFDSEMKVKIIDFGIAKMSTLPYLYGRQGTPNFCAPEVGQTRYNSAADIYSFGRVLLKMCGDIDLMQQNNDSRISPLIKQLHSLMTRCTDKEPSHRPTATQCVDQLKEMLQRATKLMEDVLIEMFYSTSNSKEPLADPWTLIKNNSFGNEDELKAQLKTLQLIIRDNQGNGDCLPYSLIDYLSVIGDYEGNCNTLREQIANYVRDNWQHLSATYPDNIGAIIDSEDKANEWAERYRRPQEWCEAEFACICAVIFKFRLEIFVMNERGSLERIVFEPVNIEDYTVRLAYVNNNHYVSVWPDM